MDLDSLKEHIHDLLTAFSYNYFGRLPITPLDKAEYKRLVAKGLIKKLKVDSLTMLYGLGKAASNLGDQKIKQWGTPELGRYMLKEGELTGMEQRMLKWLKSEALGSLNQLFGVVETSIQHNYRTKMLGSDEFRDKVQEVLAEGIKNRRTIGAIRGDIGRATKEWGRDLYRLTMTETNNCYQMGKALGYLKRGTKASDVFVAKIPRGEGISCPDCLRLYLQPNGDPKIFRLSDIIGSSNIGKKRREWQPVVTSTHPWCSCEIVRVYKGMVFNKKYNRFEYKKTE